MPACPTRPEEAKLSAADPAPSNAHSQEPHQLRPQSEDGAEVRDGLEMFISNKPLPASQKPLGDGVYFCITTA